MKVFVVGMLAWLGMMSVSSCSKNYTCQCTFQDTTKNFSIEIEKVTKNEATVVCDDYKQFVGNCALK